MFRRQKMTTLSHFQDDMNSGMDMSMDATTAAECLLAIAASKPSSKPPEFMETCDEEGVFSPDGVSTGNHHMSDPSGLHPHSHSSLFMVARILADLEKYRPRQEIPSPISDCPSPPPIINGPYDGLSNALASNFDSFAPTPQRGDYTNQTQAGKQRNRRSKPSQNLNSVKKHHCHYHGCEKIYGKSSHLKAHLRTHTGKTDFN
ncbi:Krueppel-like factor 13 [Lytechinus pictus]|uniref:Krueppel-like factor 13 n=1 Tax=Lytechinus pictus TaxID=7653 RepID=UPI0030BA09A9